LQVFIVNQLRYNALCIPKVVSETTANDQITNFLGFSAKPTGFMEGCISCSFPPVV